MIPPRILIPAAKRLPQRKKHEPKRGAPPHGKRSVARRGSLASGRQTPNAIAPPGSLEGESSAKAGLILYPGAKVDPHAYVPLAEKIAERGYICVIAKMPFNLAFFGIDAAQAS